MAAFPGRAANQVRKLGNRLTAEVQKKKDAEAKKAGKRVEQKPEREIRRVRPSEVATVTRVTNETEWNALRNKLDERVCELLKDYDVELG